MEWKHESRPLQETGVVLQKDGPMGLVLAESQSG